MEELELKYYTIHHSDHFSQIAPLALKKNDMKIEHRRKESDLMKIEHKRKESDLKSNNDKNSPSSRSSKVSSISFKPYNISNFSKSL